MKKENVDMYYPCTLGGNFSAPLLHFKTNLPSITDYFQVERRFVRVPSSKASLRNASSLRKQEMLMHRTRADVGTLVPQAGPTNLTRNSDQHDLRFKRSENVNSSSFTALLRFQEWLCRDGVLNSSFFLNMSILHLHRHLVELAKQTVSC